MPHYVTCTNVAGHFKKDPMKLIDELIEELSDKNNRLTDILIKAKILAYKLKNDELKKWIENELNGYPDGKVPDYRIIPCQLIGSVSNGFQRANRYPIPVINVEEKLRIELQQVRLAQSISSLDEAAHEKKGGGALVQHLPVQMYAYLSKDFDNGFVIEHAQKEIDRIQIVQVLTAVKSKLIDFLLKLNEDFSDKDFEDVDKGKTKEKIDSLFNSTIFGDNTTIIVGDRNKQSVRNKKIIKGNFEILKEELLKNGIKTSDVEELKQIIDTDEVNPEKKEFGTKVKTWISKMMTKAIDGTWKIGLGAAGKLLADSLQSYYGW
jgi:hypothetical protein